MRSMKVRAHVGPLRGGQAWLPMRPQTRPLLRSPRLDRLPPSRHTRKLIALLSLGAWFEFYDLFFPAYVAIGLFKEGLFKPTTSGLFDLQGFASLIASGFAGMF